MAFKTPLKTYVLPSLLIINSKLENHYNFHDLPNSNFSPIPIFIPFPVKYSPTIDHLPTLTNSMLSCHQPPINVLSTSSNSQPLHTNLTSSRPPMILPDVFQPFFFFNHFPTPLGCKLRPSPWLHLLHSLNMLETWKKYLSMLFYV